MISAIIFDFDGVIADSERLHWAAFNAVLTPRNRTIPWEEYIDVFMGFDDRDAFRHALPHLNPIELINLIEEKAVAFQMLLKQGGAAALPGVVDLIQHLSGQLPLAICSGALLEDILPITTQLEITPVFNTIVTAEDTLFSKPDPAPYRLALKKLGMTSGLAIEDTPAGITSAHGAGLKVLAITNSYPASFLTEAEAIVDTLEGLTLDALNQLFC